MNAAAAIARPRRAGLDVDGCEARLAEHLSAVIRRFGARALGLVDLPPIEVERLSRAELGVAGVLLWARHVDEAGLLEAVSALAKGISDGTMAIAVTGPAARRLIEWHRHRADHFATEERHALYERLFGGSVATQLAALIAALVELGRASPILGVHHLHARIAVAARDLAGSLSARATGIAAFAARDIVQQVRDALAILGDPEVAAQLGGGGPWTLIARHAANLLRREVDPPAALARASAAQALATWLADHVDEITAGTVAPSAGDPVVHAALAFAAEGG